MKNQNSITIELKEGERLDDLQKNGFRIIQDPKRSCFGMDAVLLSGFCTVRPGETVLDIGTGTGIIPILLKAKTPGKHFSGIEIQEESADMAKRIVALNGLEKEITIICGDIRNAKVYFEPVSFHVVTVNPPYMIAEHGLENKEEPRNIARHEITCTLEDVVREGATLLRNKGRFYMVHRPFRLTEIFETMQRYRLEPKRIRFVHPFLDKEPGMVLIEGLKGGRGRLTVEKPLIIYRKKGEYSREIKEEYGF